MSNASIVTRLSKDGKTRSYQVKWVHESKGQSITFHQGEYEDARALRKWLKGRDTTVAKTDSTIVERHYLHGEAAPVLYGMKTFASVAAAWVEQVAAEGVTDKHVKTLQRALTYHANHPAASLVQRAGMPRPIAEVGSDDLKRLYFALMRPGDRAPLARSSAIGVMARITGMLKWAHAHGHTPYDLSLARARGELKKIPTPKLRRTAARGGLEPEQVAALRAVMPSFQDDLIIHTWVATGCRTAEIFALEVGNLELDSDEPTIHFTHQMDNTKRVVGTKGRHGDDGDEEGEDRHRQEIDDVLAARLRAHVAGRAPHEPVFPRPYCGRRTRSPFINPKDWTRYVWNVVRGQAGLSAKVTPYWLRHTTASWLWAETGDVAVVGRKLRHRDPRTTAVYTHDNQAMRRKVRAASNQTFGQRLAA